MALAQLSEAGQHKLRALEREQKKVKFCHDHRVHNQTFDKLRDGKYVREHVVEKVESLLTPPEKPVTEDAAFRIAASFFDKTEQQLRDPVRKPSTVEARLFLAYILHKDGGLTKPQVSKIMGYSDHTGAYQAVKAMEKYLSGKDEPLKARYAAFRAKVRAAM